MASPVLHKELLKRGRAYRCLSCPKQIGERRYIISHVYKYHISLDSVPYYCSLCHFQTDDGDKLEEHIKSYSKHREAREALLRSGKYPEDDRSYLHKNQDGVRATEDIHYEKLGKEESLKIWAERLREEGKGRNRVNPSATALAPAPVAQNLEAMVTPPPAVVVQKSTPNQAESSFLDFPDLLELQDPVSYYTFLDGEPTQSHTCRSTPVSCMSPMVPVETAFVPVTPETRPFVPTLPPTGPDTAVKTESEEEQKKKETSAPERQTSRSSSPTRLMFDIVNHMFHMQNTMRNILHELQSQTDILRSIRDQRGHHQDEPRRRSPEKRNFKRPTQSYPTGPSKRFNNRK